MDPTRHNYYPKLLELHRQGKIPAASASLVDIYHDEWCAINHGGYCNCDPDVEVRLNVVHDGTGNGHS